MTTQDLARLASFGEGPFLEFKNRVPRPTRIAKEAIAFANTRGGKLLIGIDDDGTAVGVKDAIEEEFALRRALEHHVEPPLEYQTERVRLSRKRDVIVVTIPKSRAKPHFLVHDDEDGRPHRPGTAYVRSADQSIEASPEAFRLMRMEGEQTGVTFEFGDKEQLLMRYLDEYGHVTVDQFADLAGTRRRDASDRMLLLTRAGLLELHPNTPQDYFTLAAAKVD